MDGIFGLVAATNRDRLVGRDCKTGRNDLGELKTLELKEATADILEISRIKLSTSDLPEEMVKRIIATLASFVVISGRRHGAVVSHGAIAGVLSGLLVPWALKEQLKIQRYLPEPVDVAGNIGWGDAGQCNHLDQASQEHNSFDRLVLSKRDHSMRRCNPHLKACRFVNVVLHWNLGWESA